MRNDPLIEILIRDFRQKKARNRSYSLRSYARHLDIDPSNLSKILSRKAELGSRLRAKLGQRLGFEKTELETWLKPALQKRTVNQAYNPHPLEIFQLVSEWQHYAILEYFKINPRPKPDEIANALGLSVSNAKSCLERLAKVGLLTETKEGLRPADEASSSILDTATSHAHRLQQKQILEGAIEALDKIPIERRSQSSMTMAIDSKKLGQAKEVIKNFRRDLGRLLSSSSELDHVYQLSISLYPKTQQQGEIK